MLALLALASVVLFMLVLSGAVAIDSSPTASQTTETTKTTSAAEASPATATTTTRTKAAAAPKAAPKTATQSPATPAPKPAQLTTVVLTASRGDCWFQARAGSAQVKVLDERVLGQGESTSIKSKSVWLTVGASGNLDVTVNGKPQALAAGTVSVVLGTKGTTN